MPRPAVAGLAGPLVLLVPSHAAAVEWPRRLAEQGRALCGVYARKPRELARDLAEPALLGRGLGAWDPGHDALLAARLLEAEHGLHLPEGAPRASVAAALGRTLAELRLAGATPEALQRLVTAAAPGDAARLLAVSRLYAGFHEVREGRVADTATRLVAAGEHVAADWLRGASFLILDDVPDEELDRRFLAALARVHPVKLLLRPRPLALYAGSFAEWAHGAGIASVAWAETPLAALAPPSPPPDLQRLRDGLFEPAAGAALAASGLELVTAAGEAAEARAIARRLLREARRGVPFEQMGIVLPRPTDYASIFADLFDRLGIPHRLHPSLPLRHGRAARSLLLLLRCRGLERAAVIEFLSFAPLPVAALLGPGIEARPGAWDRASRDARVVSGLERWRAGLRVLCRDEENQAQRERDPARRERREARLRAAQQLDRLVEALHETLQSLEGEAGWDDWSRRLEAALDRFVGEERDRETVVEVLHDLRGLGAGRVPFADVLAVLESRFEWERVPLPPVPGGAVHVGALDAMAGLTFRVVAIPGLVEGGYPGTPRPDPFLLDAEREALARPAADTPPAASPQLSLFDDPSAEPGTLLRTSQARLLEARRDFHRAVSQAVERLILSYPRADPRSGRERLPSLFFVAAASSVAGRALGLGELLSRVVEDDEDTLGAEAALDAGQRDRARVKTGGREAATHVARGSRFFRQSRLATEARWSSRLTPYDGLVAFSPKDGEAALDAAKLLERLDPARPGQTLSASRLAVFTRCGFQYLLGHVLRLEAREVPEERKRLEPLERGNLFHRVAEEFLRERRELGRLPVTNDAPSQERLLALADTALAGLVEGSPPRFTLLWEREQGRFREGLLVWLEREAAQADKRTPAYFEVGFGVAPPEGNREPWSEEPLRIELGAGRSLRIAGRIDRIDRKPDGSLVLRDYKTGRAPLRDEGGLFKGGRQLQIPFYVLAARALLPDASVSEAFLDYVDGGRRVSFDPLAVATPEFRANLDTLVQAIAQGLFVQEPTACDWCDFTEACGPKALIARRRSYKLHDPFVRRVLRLRDL